MCLLQRPRSRTSGGRPHNKLLLPLLSPLLRVTLLLPLSLTAVTAVAAAAGAAVTAAACAGCRCCCGHCCHCCCMCRLSLLLRALLSLLLRTLLSLLLLHVPAVATVACR